MDRKEILKYIDTNTNYPNKGEDLSKKSLESWMIMFRIYFDDLCVSIDEDNHHNIVESILDMITVGFVMLEHRCCSCDEDEYQFKEDCGNCNPDRYNELFESEGQVEYPIICPNCEKWEEPEGCPLCNGTEEVTQETSDKYWREKKSEGEA